jgi:hypothetical protein
MRTCIHAYMHTHSNTHTQAGDYISPETLESYTDFEVSNWPLSWLEAFIHIYIYAQPTYIHTYIHAYTGG